MPRNKSGGRKRFPTEETQLKRCYAHGVRCRLSIARKIEKQKSEHRIESGRPAWR
jgi:hypothetical protein